MKDYLAIASDSPTILIYDVSDLRKRLEAQEKLTDLSENESNQQHNTATHKLVATLNGHYDKVVCLAWSPHVTGYLVSGSYDYTAQVSVYCHILYGIVQMAKHCDNIQSIACIYLSSLYKIYICNLRS